MPRTPSLRQSLALPVLFALALPACDAGPTAAEHVDRARAFVDKRDLSASVIELKNALQKEPENPQARLLLGKVYLDLGDGAGAEKELARAGRLGASDPDLPVTLARALLLERKYQEALDQLARAPADPPSARVLVLQGEAHLGLGRREESRAAFNRALETEPGLAAARLGLASLALAEGRTEDAEKQVTLALEKNPDDLRALLLRGELLLARRDLEGAEAAFAKALEVGGERNTTARLALARARLARGDLDGASAQVEQVRKHSPQEPLANYLRGAVAYQRKDMGGAQEALRDVLRVVPDHLPSLLLLGTVDYAEGRLEQAEEHLSRYSAAVPDHMASRKLLAAVRLARNEPDRALEALAPAAKEAAGDPQLLALLGTAHLRKGDAARAEEYLTQASQLAPDVAAIRTQLALTHLAAGEAKEAVAELQSAVDLGVGTGQAEVLLVLTHLRQGQTDEALAAARRLAERQPENPLTHNLVGAAYLAKQDTASARSAFEQALRVSASFAPAALNLAQLDVREGKRDAARARYESVLSRDEHNVQALVGLARLAGEANEGARAVELLERARQHHPSALEPRLMLAAYYLDNGPLAKAVEVTQEAIKLAPENTVALGLQGQTELLSGHPADAARTFGALVAKGVKTPDLHARLAAAQLGTGKRDEARASFSRALELSEGKHAGALLGLGRLDIAAGKPEAARERVERLKTLYPASPAGPGLEGDMLFASRQPAAAVAAYQDALAKGGGADLVLKLSQARRAAGDETGGLQAMRDWLAQHPQDGAVRLGLASSLQASGARDAAVKEYELLVTQQPKNAVALNNLAWLYFESKDPRAADLAQRALAEAPENPAILDTVGWIRVQQGQVEQGVQLLRQAAEKAPREAEIRYHLGAALARSGDMARARQELEAAIAGAGEAAWKAEAKRLLDLLP